MIRYILPALFMLALLMHGAARAEDAPAPEQAAEKASEQKTEEKPEAAQEEKQAGDEIPEGVKAHQKAAEEVFELTKQIAVNLNPDEQKHFFLLYNNYNLIGTVKMVQEDVGNAVKACSEANPDMKEGLDSRFSEWNTAVNPVIKDAES